ncbi:hypothetical protein GCM10022419_069230 [Nonomuraea rosea]|uniref:ROK family protein n=1 Tax=Nonomuraea rosea TaxID=638574 RepID=A0ABP6YBQ4_9ACTN
MLGMVVSTGVGGGLILNGRLVHGGTGNAGHIGHVVVEPEDGPRCGCGGRGCLEAVARGPALTAWALAQGWIPSAKGPPEGTFREGVFREDAYRKGTFRGDAYREGTFRGDAYREDAYRKDAFREDREVTARGLAADARAGDPVALRAMRRAGRALGIAIASATHLCDLELVTIGGGLSQAGEPLFGPLEEALREHARMEFARRVTVRPAALGQEAGLVGAAALLLAGERYWDAPAAHT